MSRPPAQSSSLGRMLGCRASTLEFANNYKVDGRTPHPPAQHEAGSITTPQGASERSRYPQLSAELASCRGAPPNRRNRCRPLSLGASCERSSTRSVSIANHRMATWSFTELQSAVGDGSSEPLPETSDAGPRACPHQPNSLAPRRGVAGPVLGRLTFDTWQSKNHHQRSNLSLPGVSWVGSCSFIGGRELQHHNASSPASRESV